MLAISVTSPTARLTAPFDRVYPDIPTPGEIPSLIPPLNRLSDMSWYYYREAGITHLAQIRYIGHDSISNKETNTVIEYLFLRGFGTDQPDLNWPGLVYNVTSDEGKALLATPNSLAVAWMMVDHAAVFGRRLPRVHLFVGDFGFPNMLWDLAPV